MANKFYANENVIGVVIDPNDHIPARLVYRKKNTEGGVNERWFVWGMREAEYNAEFEIPEYYMAITDEIEKDGKIYQYFLDHEQGVCEKITEDGIGIIANFVNFDGTVDHYMWMLD